MGRRLFSCVLSCALFLLVNATQVVAQVASGPDAGTIGPNPALVGSYIVSENARTDGVTNDWQFFWGERAANREIEAFASATSINRGGNFQLFVNVSNTRSYSRYRLDVYRMGWYGGSGGRRVLPTQTVQSRQQPACVDTAVTETANGQLVRRNLGMIECPWRRPVTITLPQDAVSGFYLIRLTAISNRGLPPKSVYVPFVVRDDSSVGKFMFQASFTTYQAYNNFGGSSYYTGPNARAVSFNRPYFIDRGMGAGDFFYWEYDVIRFLERNGIDVRYSTNIDTHSNGGRLLNFAAFLSVGHDEYWTKEMYDGIEGARNAGRGLGFLGSNTAYWQVRLVPDANGNANRNMISYRYSAAADDPLRLTPLSTVQWRQSPVNRPEAALVGVQYIRDPVNGDFTIRAATANSPDAGGCPAWLCNTTTGLANGDLLPGLWGYEADVAVAGVSPANLSIIARSGLFDANGDAVIDRQDAFFDTSGDGQITRDDATGAMSYYEHGSGGRVFATGSMQFAWGLDTFCSDFQGRSRRATVPAKNLFFNVLERLAP
jgi:hypothetical protein